MMIVNKWDHPSTTVSAAFTLVFFSSASLFFSSPILKVMGFLNEEGIIFFARLLAENSIKLGLARLLYSLVGTTSTKF